tara:strand:- start:316 stop:495 length:180 start_codon:yes stop_codon:yes gene_type:complete
MAIKIEESIKEIDGIKYVPYDIVQRYITETYTNQFKQINKLVDKAMSDYDNSLKDIMND